MTLLAEVADVPLLSAGELTYRWSDAFLMARLRGEWAAFERAAAAPAGEVPSGAVKQAGQAFRTERRLLAGDELRAWLADHRMTLAEWNVFLGRSVLRAQGHRGREPAPAGVLWAEGVCSGAFDGFAQTLAARAAALAAGPAHDPGPPPSAEWPDQLWRAEAAYRRLCEEVTRSDAPRRVVAANSADWLRVDCEYLTAADEDVAREVVLLLREDGVPLHDVARQAGLEPAGGLIYAGDLQQDLRTRVMSAAPGDMIGPVGVGGSLFVVMAVRGKVAPSMDDPDIRARAERTAVDAAVAREVTERVSWHEHR
jgi:hypothetical protein